MSWSAEINIPAGSGHYVGGIENVVGADGDPEVLSAIDYTAQMVRQMFAVGTFGPDADSYDWNVKINAHFNPGHAPVQGNAKDFIQIAVTQQ